MPGASSPRGLAPAATDSPTMRHDSRRALTCRAAARPDGSLPRRPTSRPGGDMTATQATNREGHLALIAELEERLERVRGGGGERARERHVARGKLLVRDRVERLCDPGTPFLELSA